MESTRYNEFDYTASVARSRVIETRLLSHLDFEKLLTADSVPDAIVFLANAGWKTFDDYNKMLYNQTFELFELSVKLGAEGFLKTQRLKYDYHNLKALIKTELTAQKQHDILIDLGNISLKDMKNAVLNADYKLFSENMAMSVPEAYEQYAKTPDAQLVDLIFDNAYFKDLADFIKIQPDEKTLDLIKTQIDMHNIKTFMRIRKMGKTYEFSKKVIAHGGWLPYEFYIERVGSSDTDFLIFEKTPYSALFLEEDLERSLDNYFIQKVKKARKGPFGLAPLAAYFFLKENEIQNVRIILTCKTAGMDENIIRKRLRG
ncbi:MAG: V-type ATPase subunit [Firmicutes bacterium]|nr:V-type ATPase subunit [Bacillota bacterium]